MLSLDARQEQAITERDRRILDGGQRNDDNGLLDMHDKEKSDSEPAGDISGGGNEKEANVSEEGQNHEGSEGTGGKVGEAMGDDYIYN
ncbi:hypothetical protein P154DRAFT_522716 [Amniculicola lignicola CBS 123094]|uniref:Uncharacterized protein n=1 Tax=Amniculicola lignicola CBS 123094 TaxID=1392246 RepID=A0A6A5WED7_9PLEO|nr:hypothetical protein P154DRAFT_522716 [Amniculicola lignicola CBS 123094]